MLVNLGINSKCSTKVQSKCMLRGIETLHSHSCLCHLFFLFLFNDNSNCNPETKGHLSQDDMSMQTEHLQQMFNQIVCTLLLFFSRQVLSLSFDFKLCCSNGQRINSLVVCILQLPLFPPTKLIWGWLLFHLDVMSALCILDASIQFDSLTTKMNLACTCSQGHGCLHLFCHCLQANLTNGRFTSILHNWLFA